VNKIYSDSKDNIWVATNSGVNRYIPETGGFDHFYYNGEKIVKKINVSKDTGNPKWDIIYSVYEDAAGRLWLGSYLDGVYIWDRDTGKTEHLAPGSGSGKSISNQMVFDIKGDKFGNVWIGTNCGLNRYDIKTGKISVFLYDSENTTGISNNVISRIFKDSAGDMWFGTSGGGLSKLDYASDSFLHVTKKNGLNNNSVTGISEDTRGNLVVTTIKGISIINRGNREVFNVTYQFGLNGKEIKGNILRDKDGNFYISTAGTIYKINTEKYYVQNYEPEIVISDFKVFNDAFLKSKNDNIFSQETIELSWKENSISFNFVSLDYTFPLNNMYKYMLEGFDWDWVSAGNRTYANYTNLPSGKYVFRVMGTNSSGKWSGKESSVNIIISPPPYKTIYAYFLYAAAVFLLFYSLHIILRGKETEKRLAEENKLKNKLLKVNSELDRLTRIDSLTGVYNRYHFTETLYNGWHLHERLNLTISLLMIDIDFFKNYNDTYGHVAGDECLRAFAEIMVEAVSRKTDTVFRYGGEEFIIVLLDTGLEGASVVAEKLQEKLASEKIDHSGSSISRYLTASIGIVSTDKGKYSSSGEMVLDVDRKLYLAKEHGRNTVIC